MRHPARLRLEHFPETPVVVWWWCVDKGMCVTWHKQTLAYTSQVSTLTWLPEFRYCLSRSCPYHQPLTFPQTLVGGNPEDTSRGPPIVVHSNELCMYALPFGRQYPVDVVQPERAPGQTWADVAALVNMQ